MKTKNKESILFLKDGTAICYYCGKKLIVEHKSEWDEYDEYKWNEYECTCSDWDKAIELDNKLEELNKNFYRNFCRYQNDFINELHKNGSLKISKNMYQINKNKLK